MHYAFKSLLGLSLTIAATTVFAGEGDGTTGKKEGYASYYADKFHGRRTANGEIFDQNALTAAHRGLPMGSMVRVKRLDNGKTITVRINDRGPYSSYMIDLSKAAAKELGLIGIKKKVSIEVLGKDGVWTPEAENDAAIVPVANVEALNQQPPTITAESELNRSRAGAAAQAAASGRAIPEERIVSGRRGKHGRHGKVRAGKSHGKVRGGKAHGKSHAKGHATGSHKKHRR